MCNECIPSNLFVFYTLSLLLRSPIAHILSFINPFCDYVWIKYVMVSMQPLQLPNLFFNFTYNAIFLVGRKRWVERVEQELTSDRWIQVRRIWLVDVVARRGKDGKAVGGKWRREKGADGGIKVGVKYWTRGGRRKEEAGERWEAKSEWGLEVVRSRWRWRRSGTGWQMQGEWKGVLDGKMITCERGMVYLNEENSKFVPLGYRLPKWNMRSGSFSLCVEQRRLRSDRLVEGELK